MFSSSDLTAVCFCLELRWRDISLRYVDLDMCLEYTIIIDNVSILRILMQPKNTNLYELGSSATNNIRVIFHPIRIIAKDIIFVSITLWCHNIQYVPE